MRKLQSLGVAFLAFLLVAAHVVWRPTTQAQTTTVSAARAALERGYRTGYSDGYQEGFRDIQDNKAEEFRNNPDYINAARAYEAKHGPRESYRDGYQQGYGKGYAEGYARRAFSPSVPPALKPRAAGATTTTTPKNTTTPTDNNGNTGDNGIITPPIAQQPSLPANTVMKVELLNALSTATNSRDDGFRMRVLEPQAYEGAIVEGHLARVKRPGRIKGRAELQLTFDRIRLPNQTVANFEGQIIELTDPTSTNVRNVDQEGGLEGKSTQKEDTVKVGAAAGAGAVIGVIGGPVGAGVGAIVGAGAGAGYILYTRGADIRLTRGQQFKLVSSGNARFVASAPETAQ